MPPQALRGQSTLLAPVATPAEVKAPGPAEPHLERFGAYDVERLLGEGTMGRVYQARHHTLGRRVAIKALRGALTSDPSLVSRFLQEAKLVNTINHPHIVECFDFVEDEGATYSVMELLEGQTLAARLEAGPLALDEALAIATQLAQALEAAHALGVVHRDLKPENVMLTQRDGRAWVKVLDFGIAKLSAAQPQVVETQAGTVLGTPRYMAPEQLAALEVDPRADLYAWGVVLFEMVAGHAPFEAENFALLASDVITRPAPALPTVSRSGELVPEWLRALVADCLAKRPVDRPSSAAAVLARLEQRVAPRRVRWRPIALACAGLAVAAFGVVWLRSAGPAASAAVAPPPVSAPAAPTAVPDRPAAQVALALNTTPAGATVVDVATGRVLGQTPLSVERAQGGPALRLRFELRGYTPEERDFTLDQSVRAELALQPLPKARSRPAAPKVVTDGVLDY